MIGSKVELTYEEEIEKFALKLLNTSSRFTMIRGIGGPTNKRIKEKLPVKKFDDLYQYYDCHGNEERL